MFRYPTYVAQYVPFGDERQAEYEFISIDEPNRRIIYVYVFQAFRKSKNEYRELIMPSEYQPVNYYDNLDPETSDGYYHRTYQPSESIWFD